MCVCAHDGNGCLEALPHKVRFMLNTGNIVSWPEPITTGIQAGRAMNPDWFGRNQGSASVQADVVKFCDISIVPGQCHCIHHEYQSYSRVAVSLMTVSCHLDACLSTKCSLYRYAAHEPARHEVKAFLAYLKASHSKPCGCSDCPFSLQRKLSMAQLDAQHHCFQWLSDPTSMEWAGPFSHMSDRCACTKPNLGP